MAHDEKISEPTGNDVHHEPPASASAPAQMPDVATLRAMMHERQYAAGKAFEQQLEADVLHAREVQEELLFEMIEANKTRRLAAITTLPASRRSRTSSAPSPSPTTTITPAISTR